MQRRSSPGSSARAVIVLMLVAVPGLFRNLPQPTLAAVVIAAALSLADIAGMRRLWVVRRTEFALSIAAFLGVAVLGVLPGIAIAVGLSILNVFRRSWWPYSTLLGRVDGIPGYHDVRTYPGRRAGRRPPRLPIRRTAVLRERPGLPRARPRAASSDTPGLRWLVVAAEPDHRRRHDGGRHARAARRGSSTARASPWCSPR